MNGQALSAWNERVHAACGRFDTRYDHCQSLFIGEMQQTLMGSTAVAHIRSNASVIAKAARSGERDSSGRCFLVLQQQGSMAIELGDRVVDLRHGDLALLDFSGAVKMTPNGLFSHVSIPLPRELFKGLERSRFGKLSTTGVCGQLLCTLVRQVAGGELAQWSCPQDGDGVQRALVALLESVLEYQVGADSPGWQLHEVQSVIRQRLDSPRLSPASLAEELGTSSRQLYRLFEASGDSVCRYILRERLLKAAQDLRDPVCAQRSITDIGSYWGFTDSAHFSKTFKKQTGMTPSRYRSLGH
ncbi:MULTISPECIES: transcriptional regulator FeaR [unclassified Pseudomonas]|uniref:transcriptional regulator FeaR n=1 Tax=unclassified Pseudomonas TaxID=196821 RepID=UPI0007034625|nr:MULTISPECIES: transcriptional regulator FeaR [unclassified Pseudomonas]KQM54024.1 transcriptional regulator [Pseudomonas sp. Leaf15]MCF5233218.1 transcriptional regulator FeaR [Pseudomonas sp. PA-5-4H]MCF5238910.1 transcriptional regulator FeaR [Pseudomonas sp. PA-5-4G]MCF5248951.1 transcriptional regulator FeaR [Pseudomonas sp. PA-5-4B]MCF5255336.1 transcriptional regulator FeaR [Pseudomonas sp. PA-5-4B]